MQEHYSVFVLKKCFHAQHGEAIIMAFAEGTEEQKEMIQECIKSLVGSTTDVLWTCE